MNKNEKIPKRNLKTLNEFWFKVFFSKLILEFFGLLTDRASVSSSFEER